MYDLVAKEYGLTPDQFFAFTPKQCQQVLDVLKIRLHNEQAMQLKMHNFKADFIDVEAEKMMREISQKNSDHTALAKSQQEKHHGKP